MISKVWTSVALALTLVLQVSAHAAISPALGVAGTPKRNNVKRPNGGNPCGAGVNVAAALDSSTAATANAAGTFNAVAINFNGGGDGSRRVTAKVDATGKGTNFVAMTVTTNGDAAPKTTGQQPIVATLPAGTKCTGGAGKNKCLVQFTTTAGFGNCVVVSQGAAAAGNAVAGNGQAKGGNKKAAGTRAARAAANEAAESDVAEADETDAEETAELEARAEKTEKEKAGKRKGKKAKKAAAAAAAAPAARSADEATELDTRAPAKKTKKARKGKKAAGTRAARAARYAEELELADREPEPEASITVLGFSDEMN